jgi:cysteine desulfurase
VIYLDHNATTSVLPEVRDVILPYLNEHWGNPSSAYRFGAEQRLAIEAARQQVADLAAARPGEVIFTSGATEANNTAIHAALAGQVGKRHIVTSRVEHSSVLAYAQELARQGVEVTYLSVDETGQIDLDELAQSIRADTAAVSLMWANNETGVIFPVSAIGEICREKRTLFHCDAVQAVGKVPVNFSNAPIDYLTLSGHKLGAPKGTGALIARQNTPFMPLIVGGKQEDGRRGGTESVPLIVGLGAACETAAIRGFDLWQPIMRLRDQFEARILAEIPGAYLNGAAGPRLPNTSNFGIQGIDSDGLVAFLDGQGICVSSGAACLENSLSPSHVVHAMTGSHQKANEALRVSLGWATTAAELDHLLALLPAFAAAAR